MWFWAKGRFWVYVLSAKGRAYELREESAALPGLDLAEIARVVGATDESHQTEAVRDYRRSLSRKKRRRLTSPAPGGR